MFALFIYFLSRAVNQAQSFNPVTYRAMEIEFSEYWSTAGVSDSKNQDVAVFTWVSS